MLAANARMWAITERSAAAWRAIITWLSRVSGVDVALAPHEPPAPISELWARPGLGCVAMCGWPFVEARPRPLLLAAPVPSPPAFAGRPEYWSDLVVRRDGPFGSLEDTFGGTVGWTVSDSHSGFNMLRRHLSPAASPFGQKENLSRFFPEENYSTTAARRERWTPPTEKS